MMKVKKSFPIKFSMRFSFLILIILSFLTRFLFLSYPAEVVFDEVHFGKFVSAYFQQQFYFDIHPPLGKLLIFGLAKKVFNLSGETEFNQIGQELKGKTLFILRFLPALLGSLFVLLIYQFVLLLGLSEKSAFWAGFFVLFENSFLIQSKFILIDIFLLFFGFLALYFWLLAKRLKSPFKREMSYILSALFATFSFSTKWTGLSFLGIILFFSFLEFLKELKMREFLARLSIFILLPFLIYLSIFAIHFHLLKNSGSGDLYLSEAFQKSLIGNKVNQAIKPLNFWEKFLELNRAMYKYNAGLEADHPNASQWFEWPLMRKPIWYWNKSLEKKSANIYFIGNPLIWYLVLFSLILSLLIIFLKKQPFWFYLSVFGFFLNFLPFIFIERVTFLYSFLPAFSFGIILLAGFWEKFFSENPLFSFIILTSIFLTFLFFSPLTYGFALPKEIESIYQLIVKFFS